MKSSKRSSTHRYGIAGLASFAGLIGSVAILMLGGCQVGEDMGGKGRIPNDPSLGPNANKNVLSYAFSTVPAQFNDVQITASLSTPVAMDFAPDGRLFVCEKGGNLRIIKNGALLSTPFMTLSVDQSGERGLLGLAFDPNFSVDKYVYVYYTPSGAGHNRVSRFLVSSANPDLVQAGSEQILLDLETLDATIHNAGAIHFGADGKLYIAVGENSQPTMAQRLDVVLGKIARINKDGTIPTDNPFYATQSGKARSIWAYGLRNPFTFAVQPGTGRIFVNDVGQDKWEEIDDIQRGGNYGWADAEGNASQTGLQYVHPFLVYDHTQGCAIVGASFYNPANQQFPTSYLGKYFYGDYCQGWIKDVDPTSGTVANFATGITSLVDIKAGPEGALYYLTLNGVLSKISYTGSDAPSISVQPQNVLVTVGASATFSVSASGTNLNYQWQRNGANISGANAASYTLANAQTGDNGATFRAVVSNASGSAASSAATLSVTTSKPPVPVINTPAAGSTYTGGMVINYSGSATDPDEGTLPASDLTWTVTFQHDIHNHPVSGPTTGVSSGSFTAASSGETSPNVWYRITLTAKDASGLTATVIRDIQPIKSNVTLASSPSGLQLKLDGQPITTPYTFQGVAGIIRSVEAVSPQALNGSFCTYASWSDGGAIAHNLTTPTVSTTYTANYNAATWLNQDVGAVGVAGSFANASGTYTVKGSGADIYGTADAFQYAYQNLPGDGMITARVVSVQNTDPWAKAGLMIRESTAAGARHSMMSVTSGHGTEFLHRDATNGASVAIAGTGTAPRWVRLVRSGPSIKGFQSSDGNAWTQLGEAVQSMGGNLLIGLEVLSHNNAALNTSTFDNVSVVRDNWVSHDVGNPGAAGSASGYGTVQVHGGGADIYGNSDGFFYWSRGITGDGEIKARVVSVQYTDAWAKAGVMIREDFTGGSRHALMSVTPGHGIEFMHRDAAGGASTPVQGNTSVTAPYWVRVSRTGNVFTASASPDGVTWTTVGTATISMVSAVNVGLAVCSHQGAVINNSVFDNITVSD